MIKTLVITALLCPVAFPAEACTERRISAIEKTILGGSKAHGDRCEVTIRRGWYTDAVYGYPAADEGNGVVRQSFITGICDGDILSILSDCAGNRTLINQSFDGRYTVAESHDGIPYSSELHLMFARLERDGVALSIETVHGAAADYTGIERNLVRQTVGDLEIGGHTVDVACGCREYYPDSVGASQ